MKYKNMLNAGLLLIEEMSNVEDPILDFGEVFEDRLMMEAYLAGFGGSVSGEQKMISDDLLEDLLHQYIEDSNERLKDIFDCTASKQHGRRYHRVMSRKHQRRKNKIAATATSLPIRGCAWIRRRAQSACPRQVLHGSATRPARYAVWTPISPTATDTAVAMTCITAGNSSA